MAAAETLIQLFIAFAKIGFTSFGGTSMIPLIMDEMSSHGWMTDADLTNLIAIAEMTPGSLGVNAATFAGTKTAGMLGGIFAVLGVLSPTLTLTLLAAVFFQKFRTSKVMSYIMRIVKPICIGMVLGVLVALMGLARVPMLDVAAGWAGLQVAHAGVHPAFWIYFAGAFACGAAACLKCRWMPHIGVLACAAALAAVLTLEAPAPVALLFLVMIGFIAFIVPGLHGPRPPAGVVLVLPAADLRLPGRHRFHARHGRHVRLLGTDDLRLLLPGGARGRPRGL